MTSAIATLTPGQKAAATRKRNLARAIARGDVLPASAGPSPKVNGRLLYAQADKAGKAAAQARIPTPMVVQQHANVFDDASPFVQSWKVSGGVCGFAWVDVRPANSRFAHWLVKNGKGRVDHFAGGVTVWVGDYQQSMERKEAYAGAFAKVLRDAGIRAYAQSRMD